MNDSSVINKVLDYVDELSILINNLNRAIAKEDYSVAYSIAKRISDESLKLAELFYLSKG